MRRSVRASIELAARWRARLEELPAWVERWGDELLHWVARLGIDQQAVLLAGSAAIGFSVGLATLVFYGLLDGVGGLVTRVEHGTSLPRGVLAALVLGSGLAVVRLLVRHLADDSPGENVPDIMHAVARRGGRIRLRLVAVKSGAAAVTIATGGSLGAEGPAAVLGAGLGSAFGQALRFRTNRLRLLVGCGSAAGISAAFGAPIAGVFFAMEKILGNLRASLLAAVAVASVMAAVVTRSVLGEDQVIRIPRLYTLGSGRDLAAYALVALLAGAIGVAYNRGTWWLTDLFAKVRPAYRIPIGAAVIALLAAQFPPELWGRGHTSLDLSAVAGQSALVLLALGAARILATGITLGAGGVGGVFMSAILIGGSVGGSAGVLIRTLFHDPNIAVGPYALVGMAAVVAGATHAPLTAMFIVLEVSSDYGLILPVMLAASLGYVMARRLHSESIYSEWLTRKGERLSHGEDRDILSQLRVGDFLRKNPETLWESARLGDVVNRLRDSSEFAFPVLDKRGGLVGMLSWTDVKRVLGNPDRDDAQTVGSLARRADVVVGIGDSLEQALRQIRARDVDLAPVVSPDGRLAGTITPREIYAAYDKATD